MPNFKKARVIKHEVPASTYHDIVFEAMEPFVFEPGQFISVKVNEERLNSYSIAGKLDEARFGLIVDIKPGGPGSKFFENLQVGSEIEYLGPLGKFVLRPDDGSEKLIMLGTGSGIAPLKAMIERALRDLNMKTPIDLYFGLRHREDVFWDKYFGMLASEYENFKFSLCLSKPDESWQGLTGHITDFLRDKYPDASRFSSYSCGAQSMIEEASQILAELSMPVERIYHEKFY